VCSSDLGDLNNPEDLEDLKREPWSRTVIKQDIPQYIEGDDDMIALVTKMVYQEEVVSLLEDILKMINNRGFQIKNAIEWRKLTNFGV
jgi:predicted transcriptional regulator